MKNKDKHYKRIISQTKTKLLKNDIKTLAKSNLDNLKFSVNLAEDYIKGNYPILDKKIFLALITVLVYFLNPMDLIPDFLFAYGFLDDFTVLSLFFKKYQTELKKYKEWKESKLIEDKNQED